MGYSVSIGKKRGGPSHRVAKDEGDGYPFPNDWLEGVIVVTALVMIAGGAYFMYYLSNTV